MKKLGWLVPAALALAAAVRVPDAVHAQDAPAPAPAVDSNTLWAGDWDWSANLRDSTIAGSWRINYLNGRFTGIVTRPGNPPQPVRTFTVRGKNFTMTVDWNGDLYTFTGQLEGQRSINGTLTTRGSLGRLRVQKRAG